MIERRMASKTFELAWRVVTSPSAQPNRQAEQVSKRLDEEGQNLQDKYTDGKIDKEEFKLRNKIYMGLYCYKGNIDEPSKDIVKQN